MQSINDHVCVICTRAHHLCLFLSQHVRDLKNQSEDYTISKPLSGLLVYQRIMPLAESLSSKFHICPRSEMFIFRTISPQRALSFVIKFSTTDNAFLAFWLVHSISVISSYTLVWPYMENNRMSLGQSGGKKKISPRAFYQGNNSKKTENAIPAATKKP